MAFTSGGLAAFVETLKAGMGDMLEPQQVDLHTGETISVRLHVNTRSASYSDVTSGMTAEQQMIATIDAADWDGKAPQPPNRGDVIHWAGKRYAVDQSHVAAPGGNRGFYKARLEG